MRRGVLAVLVAVALSGCVGRGQEEHGTALHHLGGPGDGVVLPAAPDDDAPAAPTSGSDVPSGPDAGAGVMPAHHPSPPRQTGVRPAAPAPTASGPILPPPAGPVMDEIIVTPLDVTGYWKITARSTFGLGDADFYKRYDKDTHICRFEQRRTHVQAYCPLLDSVGTGEIIDHTLSLSWDLASGISFHVEGQVADDRSFVGEANGRLIGLLGVTAHVPASGQRFDPPTDANPASMAAMRQALRDWDAHTVTEGAYTPNIVGRLRKLTAEAKGERGDLLSLRYLGSIDRALNKKNAPDARVTHDVYEARYARGTWLCLIHVGDDGKISDFAC